MDRRAALISILAALGTLMTALATHGSDAITALAGVPVLLQAWANGLPLGVWSFVLASVLSILVWVAAIRYLPVVNDKAPFGKANLIALSVAVAVTVAQQAVVPERTPDALLNAFILGVVAGLLAPHIGTMLRGKART